MTAWDTSSGKLAYCIENAHNARVKGVVVLGSKKVGSDTPYLIASASSDGVIRVWDVRMAASSQTQIPVAETETKSRLTCLAGSSVKCELMFYQNCLYFVAIVLYLSFVSLIFSLLS